MVTEAVAVMAAMVAEAAEAMGAVPLAAWAVAMAAAAVVADTKSIITCKDSTVQADASSWRTPAVQDTGGVLELLLKQLKPSAPKELSFFTCVLLSILPCLSFPLLTTWHTPIYFIKLHVYPIVLLSTCVCYQFVTVTFILIITLKAELDHELAPLRNNSSISRWWAWKEWVEHTSSRTQVGTKFAVCLPSFFNCLVLQP